MERERSTEFAAFYLTRARGEDYEDDKDDSEELPEEDESEGWTPPRRCRWLKRRVSFDEFTVLDPSRLGPGRPWKMAGRGDRG